MKEHLEMIIIPIGSAILVLPASIVRQILPYAPIIPEASSLSYLRGTLIVQQYKLNVLDLSSIVKGHEVREEDRREKLIWISSLQRNDILSGYVLQASATPSFMNCSEADIIQLGAGDHPLIAYYVMIKGLENPDNLPVIVPNLERLEAELVA